MPKSVCINSICTWHILCEWEMHFHYSHHDFCVSLADDLALVRMHLRVCRSLFKKSGCVTFIGLAARCIQAKINEHKSGSHRMQTIIAAAMRKRNWGGRKYNMICNLCFGSHAQQGEIKFIHVWYPIRSLQVMINTFFPRRYIRAFAHTANLYIVMEISISKYTLIYFQIFSFQLRALKIQIRSLEFFVLSIASAVTRSC